MKKAAVLTGLVVIAIVGIAYSVSVGKGGVGVGVKAAAAVCADKAPTCLPTIDMIDIKGEVFTPESLKDHVILVNFWATWCKPCKAEIPALSRTYAKYSEQGLVVLGVLDDNVDQVTIEDFMKETGLSFPVVRYDDDIGKSFEYPDRLPTTFVYDRHGKLQMRKKGIFTEAELEALLGRLL